MYILNTFCKHVNFIYILNYKVTKGAVDTFNEAINTPVLNTSIVIKFDVSCLVIT